MFLYSKNIQNIGVIGLLETPAIGVVAGGAERHGWATPNSDSLGGGRRLCAIYARVRVCARACMRACVYARVRVCMRDVFAMYDYIFDPG